MRSAERKTGQLVECHLSKGPGPRMLAAASPPAGSLKLYDKLPPSSLPFVVYVRSLRTQAVFKSLAFVSFLPFSVCPSTLGAVGAPVARVQARAVVFFRICCSGSVWFFFLFVLLLYVTKA